MQTRVRVPEDLASSETDIDQVLEAHAAVIAGLRRLIERNCRSHPQRTHVQASNASGQ